MTDTYLTLLSNGDNRFPENDSSTFTIRLDEPLFAPPFSTIALQELSFMCNHQTTNKHVKFELLDWLYKNDDSGKYGRIYEFDLGSIQLPNPQSLVSQLNFHIDKHVTRLADLNFNVFGYDADTGHITIHFPHHPKDYYFTLRLSLDLCRMVGLVKEGQGKPGSYTIIGLSKPQDKYQFGSEIRYFTDACAPAWPSAESSSNYFIFKPNLATAKELAVYSSLVQPQPVNNSRFPLLRVLNINQSPTRQIVDLGASLQHIPLGRTHISEIGIALRDWHGNELRLSEYTRVSLLIRPPPDRPIR